MRFDIDRLRDEFSIIEKSNTEQVRQYEDRIRSNQLLMEEMVKKQDNKFKKNSYNIIFNFLEKKSD